MDCHKQWKLVAFFLVGFILFLPSTLAQVDLQTGLYAYYPFNNTNDYFLNYNGTGTGEVNIIGDGFNGQALEINQSTSNSRLAISSIPMSENVTVNCWLYPTSDGTLFGRTVGAYAKPYQVIGNSDGNFQIFIGNGVSQTPTTTSDVRFTQDEWKMYTVYISSDEDVAELWVNAEQNFSQSNTGNYQDDTAIDLLLGARNDFGSPELTAIFDECSFHSRNLTLAEKQTLYNSGAGNFTWYFNESVPPVVSDDYTSFEIADFNISDITFSTLVYFDAIIEQFNTSERVNLTLFNAFNVDKTSGGGSNDIYGRVYVDGELIQEELLRSISGTNQIGSTGFRPIAFEVESGVHNITIQFRRTGNGNIQISNFDLLLMKLKTGDGITDYTSLDDEVTHGSTANFETLASSTIEVPTFSFLKFYTNSTDDNVNTYFYGEDQGVNSSIVQRFQGSGTGSLGLLYTYGGNNDSFNVYGKSSTSSTTANFSSLSIHLYSETTPKNISFSYNSHEDTDLNNNRTLTTTSHVVSTNHTKKDGDSIFIGASVSFASLTGIQTPIFNLNSTNTSVECTTKSRYLSSNSDIGNVYIFGLCTEATTVNSTYNFNLGVELAVGEELIIIDESINTFDTNIFDISRITPDISIEVFTDLINNSENINNNPLVIDYNFTQGSGATIGLVDCNLTVNHQLIETQVNLTEDTAYQFSYDTTGIEEEQNISVQCYNAEANATSGDFIYQVDSVPPEVFIQSDFVNNSVYNQNDNLRINASCFDTNLFAFNVSILNNVGEVWNSENYFSENITTNTTVNITTRELTDLGNYSVYIQCWDSHTAQKIKPKFWENTETGILIEDLNINGDIKTFNKENELITFFYYDPLVPDRYKLKITFNEDSKTHHLNLTGDELIYIPSSSYKGHFVYKYRMWLDFEGSNVEDVELINDWGNRKEIKITLINPSDEVEFNSLGDLNTRIDEYFYRVVDPQTQALENIEDILDDLVEEGQMLWIVIIIGVLMVVGAISKESLWFALAGIFFIAGSINIFIRDTFWNNGFYQASSLMMLLVGFIIIILSIIVKMGRSTGQATSDIYSNMKY